MLTFLNAAGCDISKRTGTHGPGYQPRTDKGEMMMMMRMVSFDDDADDDDDDDDDADDGDDDDDGW